MTGDYLGRFEVDTRIRVATPDKGQGKGNAELVAEADPGHYAYGLPLLLALVALWLRLDRAFFEAASAPTGWLPGYGKSRCQRDGATRPRYSFR